MDSTSRIYVAGESGMVGSAIVRALKREGHTAIITRGRGKMDLRRQNEVERFFSEERPDYVVLAAALVGGIAANNRYKGDFILQNLQIQTNVLAAAHAVGVRKLLFLGSSCIYPKNAPQPLKEEYLLTGPLEPTNEPYAIAKIAGLKTCTFLREQYGVDFISMMPTNLYGPHDNFDLESSHVLPALIRKIHEAAEQKSESVELWGSGTPQREFLHVDDCAEAALFLLNNYSDGETINVGWGEDISIAELAALVAEVVGYDGAITYNTRYPDGTPRKLLDTSRINALGWSPRIKLRDGIAQTYEWYTEHLQTA